MAIAPVVTEAASLMLVFLQENQRLKQELLKSQTTVACLHSEMDSLKTELTDQSITSER